MSLRDAVGLTAADVSAIFDADRQLQQISSTANDAATLSAPALSCEATLAHRTECVRASWRAGHSHGRPRPLDALNSCILRSLFRGLARMSLSAPLRWYPQVLPRPTCSHACALVRSGRGQHGRGRLPLAAPLEIHHLWVMNVTCLSQLFRRHRRREELLQPRHRLGRQGARR